MKLPCEIVKDLLPLYHDKICSEQTRIAVGEHVKDCEDCKSVLDSMNHDFILDDAQKRTEKAKYQSFKEIKKKLIRKNVKIMLVSILSTVATLIGLFYFVFHYQMPISYEEGLISVDKAYDSVIDITFNGKDYYSSYGFTKTIEKNGKDQHVAYIYYTDSIWTKYLSFRNPYQGYQFSIGNDIMIDYDKNGEAIEVAAKSDISAVYYLVGDYQDLILMTDDEFTKHTKNAVLLWSE